MARCPARFHKSRTGHTMFYVVDLPRGNNDQPITVVEKALDASVHRDEDTVSDKYTGTDIDFVDDALLNTAPHNAIEKQLLRGDVVGLALMSSAIIWSAMGAFG